VRKLTLSEVLSRLESRNLMLLSSEYNGLQSYGCWKCNKCSKEWSATFGNILSGKGCPCCALIKEKKYNNVCLKCNKEFKSSSPAKTCSSGCRSGVNYGKFKAKPMTEYRCSFCGGSFKNNNPTYYYCSDNCRKKSRYKRDMSNIQFVLGKNLRSRINTCLKNRSTRLSLIDLIGISLEELIVYLESKFLPGMSWDNYGNKGWHIDHIRPMSSFDLTNLEQQKCAMHYTNLQPLWAKDNLSKGAKYDKQVDE
jgi:hypothetical protein